MIIVAILIAIYLVGPTLIIAVMSFGENNSFRFPPNSYGVSFYQNYLASGPWLSATQNSILIALACMVLTMLLVVPTAMAQVRYRYRGQEWMNTFLMLPIIVPPVVSAVAYYGFLSSIGLTGSVTGMVIAHTALAIPVAYLVVSASMKGFDMNLERAAMICGASPLRSLLHVTFPVLRPGLLIGALFAFLQSFNESVVAVFIAGRNAETLPKRMFNSIRGDADPVIAVVATLITAGIVLAAIAWVVLAYSRRSRNA